MLSYCYQEELNRIKTYIFKCAYYLTMANTSLLDLDEKQLTLSLAVSQDDLSIDIEQPSPTSPSVSSQIFQLENELHQFYFEQGFINPTSQQIATEVWQAKLDEKDQIILKQANYIKSIEQKIATLIYKDNLQHFKNQMQLEPGPLSPWK